ISPRGFGSGTCWQTKASWTSYSVSYSFDVNFPETFKDSVHSAAAIWNNVTPSSFTFYYQEGSPNIISVGALPGDDIAFTFAAPDDGLPLLIATTTLNWLKPLSTEIPVPADTYNVATVMLHEFGHWLRALDMKDPMCADQVMYEYYVTPGELKLVLGIHDIEAINFQYPS
ncbi:MAG: hypothetical protein WBM17_03965, partial [Anaerolineales bacterium]